MKLNNLALIASICLVVACGGPNIEDGATKQENTQEITQENSPSEKAQSLKDTAKWIDSFRAFRDAVYQKDKEKVKQFIDFPIMNDNNEIWYLVYAGDEKKVSALTETIRPFTEKDFDKYFDSLFTKRFINCMLKIKTEELFQKGEMQTRELKEGNTSFILYATVDRSENKLSLNLAAKSPYTNEEGEIENSEFNEMYQFRILPDGKIRFLQVRLAG